MAEHRRFEYMINRSHDFVTLVTAAYVYEFANDAFCDATGRTRDAVVGRHMSEIWGSGPFSGRLQASVDRCLSGEIVEYIDTFRFGSFEHHMHVTYYPYGDAGSITHALISSHDISRLTEIESKLTRYEYLDPLTGLLNRRSLNVILEKEIYKSQRSRPRVTNGLMIISLDGFQEINQNFGIEFADLLLENTGIRVREVVRESDYVFRFDGTELTVLLAPVARPEDTGIVAEKIHDAVSMPYKHQGIEVVITSHIGIALSPSDGDTAREIIQCAHSAVAEARRLGESYCVYRKAVHEEAIARAKLKSELVNAFEAHEFLLHYQPFVDQSGRPVGAEALIRWKHPRRGLLYPASFVALAEETMLISAIDKWALYEVVRQLAEWPQLRDFYVSINISALDLLDEYLVESVELALRRWPNVAPSRLRLELTERISMTDPERSISTMRKLIGMGVDIWIDDFGTGQSSLAYLKQLPARVLKIDKVFIDEIANDAEDLVYLESIIRAIESRGKEVVIEGVSNKDQVRHLREIGCRLMQGFYFSKPVGANELLRLVSDGRPLPIESATSI